MEIYFKNDEGQLEETSLMDLILQTLSKNKFDFDSEWVCRDKEGYIEINQESKAPSEVSVILDFADTGNDIIGVQVFETPIIRMTDDDNQRKLI